MTTKIIGYIGIDSGAFVIGDLAISDWPLDNGPFAVMKQFDADAPVSQGIVVPTAGGDGIYAVFGHFEDDMMTAITIELIQ